MTEFIELSTEHLILRPMPPGAAARLPQDRIGASTILGVSLHAEWPLPDILDILPLHAGRPASVVTFGVWVMIEAATNTVVGDIGFFGPPNDAGEMEIGYSVVPSRRRRGYASEAIAALVGWALDQPTVTAIVAGTDPQNEVSQRVLQRAGFEGTGSIGTELRWRLEPAAPRA